LEPLAILRDATLAYSAEAAASAAKAGRVAPQDKDCSVTLMLRSERSERLEAWGP